MPPAVFHLWLVALTSRLLFLGSLLAYFILPGQSFSLLSLRYLSLGSVLPALYFIPKNV